MPGGIDERAFFFRSGGKPLYGVIFTPAEGKAGGRGLVVCDSLFEEKFWCERVFANLGRHLAGEGHTVLCFDYRGYGNSPGEHSVVTVHSIEQDIDAACGHLAAGGIGHISLLGIRWSAAPALAVASRREDISEVFIVNPIRDWKKEFMKALRANVAGQYSIFKKAVRTREQIISDCLENGVCEEAGYTMNNIDGYVFSRDFYSQAMNTSVPSELPPHVRSLTVFTIPQSSGKAPSEPDQLSSEISVPGGGAEGVIITGDNAFWINNRIFTSFAPNLYGELSSRMGSAEGAGDAPAAGQWPGTSDSWTGGGVKETAVTVSSEGQVLKGVLYEPEAGREDTGFVFTHGGLIGMNGAFRFNTRAARRLAAAGFPAICCDTHGVGRSGGAIEDQDQRVLFRKICGGLFADDVHAAGKKLREMTQARKVCLFGVCGGAITNIIAHARYDDLDESVLLSIPLMLPSLDYEEIRMTEGFARFYLGMYRSKLLSPGAWLRFFSGRSENRMIFKSAWTALKGKLGGGGSSSKRPVEKQSASSARRGAEQGERMQGGLETTVPGVGDDLQFNPVYLESWRSIMDRGARIYFVFGENDNFKWEFEKEFLNRYSSEVDGFGGLVRIDEIPHANHMYTLREWQDDIIGRCIEWAR